jgi:hypothetical protein
VRPGTVPSATGTQRRARKPRAGDNDSRTNSGFPNRLTNHRIRTNGYQTTGRYLWEALRRRRTISPAGRNKRNDSGATRFHGISTPSPRTLSLQAVHAPACSGSSGSAHHAQAGNTSTR